jgi:hypothetical protein
MNFPTYTFVAAALALGSYMDPVSSPTASNMVFEEARFSGQYLFKKDEENECLTDNQTTDFIQSTNVANSTINSTENFNLNNLYRHDFYHENVSKLVSSFNKEFIKHSDFITIDQNILFSGFSRLAFNLAAIDFDKASVELLRDNGIKFSLKLDEDKLLLVTNSLADVEDLKTDDIVISFFKNKKRIVSDVFKIDGFVEGFNRYLTS